jgi:hypothetical protein
MTPCSRKASVAYVELVLLQELVDVVAVDRLTAIEPEDGADRIGAIQISKIDAPHAGPLDPIATLLPHDPVPRFGRDDLF